MHWLHAGESVILFGPVGVGKTHIAQAFGQLAVRRGAHVRFAKAGRILVARHAPRTRWLLARRGSTHDSNLIPSVRSSEGATRPSRVITRRFCHLPEPSSEGRLSPEGVEVVVLPPVSFSRGSRSATRPSSRRGLLAMPRRAGPGAVQEAVRRRQH
ncbi:ATP-binding protein [Streptomyces sp. NPDC049597]|uniref:ATP-binding protein n=1 Tax=Streptomyces sp. NPDC049597 TaxID=3155276 RepID=UPI00344274B8